MSCLVCLLMFGSTAVAAQQLGPVQRANALIANGKPADAIPILDSITTASPNLPVGWALLGSALLATRQLDRAIPAFTRAISFTGARVRPTALYNFGLALALSGRMDEAFDRMRQARATGRVDMTWLQADPDAGPIREDPRYRELLPAADDYAAPFVEHVRILAQWSGDAGNDQFGWIARDLGDVEGDGVHDVVTSAPSAKNQAGTVYAMSTRAGTVLWSVDGKAGDQLGLGVEAAGDVNADGTPDVVAGAPGGDYAVVLSGRDGAELLRIPARQAGEQFGRHVAGAGDWNGDGHDDVAIGAPRNDAGGTDAGRAYLVSGADGSDLFTWTGPTAGERLGEALDARATPAPGLVILGAPGVPGGGRTYVHRGLTDAPAFTIDADSTGSSLGGMFVSVVGDLDADGRLDVYASDWSNSARGPTTGRVYLYSGRTGRSLFTMTGEGPGNGYGIGDAMAGDVDRDGHDDLVIGAWQFAGAAASGGKIYVYSGADGSLLGAVTGKVMGETLGFDATGLGDVDGDGVPDLLVTSAWSGIHGYHSGRVLVLSGADVLKTRTH